MVENFRDYNTKQNMIWTLADLYIKGEVSQIACWKKSTGANCIILEPTCYMFSLPCSVTLKVSIEPDEF